MIDAEDEPDRLVVVEQFEELFVLLPLILSIVWLLHGLFELPRPR